MIGYRLAWWSFAGVIWAVTSLIALATVSLSALVAVTVLVGVSAAGVTVAAAAVDDRAKVRTDAIRNTVVAMASTIGALGLLASLGGLGVLLGVLLASTSPPLVERLRRRGQRRRAARYVAEIPDDEQRVTERPARPCSEMETAELVLAWRASFNSLQRAQTTTATNAIVARRQRYLDELERRDPDGVRRWLESGARAASDPTRYLRHEGGGEDSPSAAA